MQNELNSPASGDGVDDDEEIGDDLLAVGLAVVTARTDSTARRVWTTCRGGVGRRCRPWEGERPKGYAQHQQQGLLSWKPSAATRRDAADQRPGADGQDATDQTGLSLPLPSSAPTRERRGYRVPQQALHMASILDKAGRN